MRDYFSPRWPAPSPPLRIHRCPGRTAGRLAAVMGVFARPESAGTIGDTPIFQDHLEEILEISFSPNPMDGAAQRTVSAVAVGEPAGTGWATEGQRWCLIGAVGVE